MRLIDADRLKNHYAWWEAGRSEEKRIFDDIVDQQPTIETKKGKWIYCEDDGQDGYRCTECGFFIPWNYALQSIQYIEDYIYCTNCGAYMGEVEGREEK